MSFQEIGQKRKMVVKIEFTPSSLTLQTAKCFPLKRVLKNNFSLTYKCYESSDFAKNVCPGFVK